jgi:hypothetical protein
MTDVRTVTLYKLLYAFYKIRKNHLPPKSLEITTYHKSTIKSDCPVTYKELSTLSNVNHQERSISLFARLISHQPAVLFSQNEPATSNQPQPASSTLLSEQTSTSHQPPTSASLKL